MGAAALELLDQVGRHRRLVDRDAEAFTDLVGRRLPDFLPVDAEQRRRVAAMAPAAERNLEQKRNTHLLAVSGAGRDEAEELRRIVVTELRELEAADPD